MIRRVGLNPCFSETNRFRGRYRLLKGSAGSGKSYNTATDFIIKLMDGRNAGANLLCVRKTFEANLYSTLPELVGAIIRVCGSRAWEVWEFNRSQPRLICRTTGNQIIFRGLKDEGQRERLKSVGFERGKLTWIWVEEAGEICAADLEILDDRLRGELREGLYYQITMTFNPVVSALWLKERFFDRVSADVLTCHTTYRDNAFIDEGFRRRMDERRRRDPSGYRVYGEGEWGSNEGTVFPNIAVRDFSREAVGFDALALGQDFGFNHPNVLLEVGLKDGNVYVLKELYERERDTNELIKMAEERGFDRELPMHCDAAEPDRIKMWQKAGFRAFGCKKYPGSVTGAINWLKAREIIIHPDCGRTAAELRGYMWQKARDGSYADRPQEYADDASAVRYACEFWMHADGFKREAGRTASAGNYRDYMVGGTAPRGYLGF